MASKRGFASMDKDKQRAISSKGGKAAHAMGVAHEFNSEEAKRIGSLGGKATAAKYGNDHFKQIGMLGGKVTQFDDSTDGGNAP